MNPAPFVDIGLNNPVYDSVNIGKKYQKFENEADDVKPTHGNEAGDQVTMESNKIDDSGLDNPLYKEVQNAFDMDDDF